MDDPNKQIEDSITERAELDIKVIDENPNSDSLSDKAKSTMYQMGNLWGNSLPGLWLSVKKQNLRMKKQNLRLQLEKNKEGKGER